jgi:hypothetical protein
LGFSSLVKVARFRAVTRNPGTPQSVKRQTDVSQDFWLTEFAYQPKNPIDRFIAWRCTVRPLLMAILGLTFVSFVASTKASSTHFDPGYYRKYTCQQLFEEGRKTSAQAIALSGQTNKGRGTDVASTEDIIVMPRIVSEGKPVSGQLALIKQQMLAIEDASIQSQCEIEFLDPPH